MSIIAKLLGSGDIIAKGFGLIDSLHVSETEAIETKAKAKTDLLSAYAPFKVAQRYLALMFSATFILSFMLVLGITLAGIGDAESVRSVIGDFYVGEIMLTIIVFYFGGGFVEGAISKQKS